MSKIKFKHALLLVALIGSQMTSLAIGEQVNEPNYVESFSNGFRELYKCHYAYGCLGRVRLPREAPQVDPNYIVFLADVLKNGPSWKTNRHLSRCYAAWCLGATKDSRSLEPLLEALEYYDPHERGGGREFVAKYAASALALLGDTNAVEPLIETLRDSRKPVKRAAMFALVKLDGSKAFEPIVDAMNKDRSCASSAIQALAMLGDMRAVRPILEVLEERGQQYKERREQFEKQRAFADAKSKVNESKRSIRELNKELSKLTKVKFEAESESIKASVKDTIEPVAEWANKMAIALPKLWSQWWYGGAEFTRKRFESKYSQWKAMKKETKLDKGNARRKLAKFTDLGIPAIPFMIEKVEEGEADFIPLISRLTDKALAEDATIDECLDWWETNKQKWLIPFPEPNDLPVDPNT